jgi:PKD repeat protein
LTPTNPKISISHPHSLRLHKSASFPIHYAARIGGTHVSDAFVRWGDGKTSSGINLAKTHTYTKPGHYFVVAIVTDNRGQQSIATTSVTVGKKLKVTVIGPTKTRHGHKARYRVTASDPNTGGKVTKLSWKWGDGHTSSGKRVSHRWSRPGKYRVKVTVRDNTGIKRTVVKRVAVK